MVFGAWLWVPQSLFKALIHFLAVIRSCLLPVPGPTWPGALTSVLKSSLGISAPERVRRVGDTEARTEGWEEASGSRRLWAKVRIGDEKS